MLLEKILKVVPANISKKKPKNVDNFLGRSTDTEVKRTLLYCLRSEYFVENMGLTEKELAKNFLENPKAKDIVNKECVAAIILFLYNKKIFTGKAFLENLRDECPYIENNYSSSGDLEFEINMLELSEAVKNNVDNNNFRIISRGIALFGTTYILKMKKVKSFENESKLSKLILNGSGIQAKTKPLIENKEQFVLRLIIFCELCELAKNNTVNNVTETWSLNESFLGIDRHPAVKNDLRNDTRVFLIS
ncbi:hypothetical protein FC19_GL000231 [Liquorilactobacillus aquaticus DSM 21051]|uniref:Uncharacterized protein n=1 Tax=Liquorilactobacillus aquaticus DSM 21051 TaxID=1423725 RepID=A0A0R2D844_9LACO|nr:hypothetical protein [Liquorilactobacillus aquaticus]KRM96715.1 hypothetical protein FC19_GL000231 [Liquorilactobacillus aquaticus DSM 21051]